MTALSRAENQVAIDSAIPDNHSKAVSPGDIRERLRDLADSALMAEDSVAAVSVPATGVTGFTANRVLGRVSGSGAGVLVDPGDLAVTPTGGSVARTLVEMFADSDPTPQNIAGKGPGDSAADQQIALDAAVAYAVANGKGVFLPGNLTPYLTTGMSLPSRCRIYGAGELQTELKLAPGANTHVVRSLNFDALVDTAATDAPHNIAVSDMTINGDSGNQSAGNGVSLFSQRPILRNLRIINTKEHGIRLDWDGAAYDEAYGVDMEGHFSHIRGFNIGKHGVYDTGQHDSHWRDILMVDVSQATTNAWDSFHIETTGRFSQLHAWNTGLRGSQRYSWYQLSSAGGGFTEVSQAHFEGGATANVYAGGERSHYSQVRMYATDTASIPNLVLAANFIVFDGEVDETFSAATPAALQLGVSGSTPQFCIVRLLSRGSSGGVIDHTFSGGFNDITLMGFQSSGTTEIGRRHVQDRFHGFLTVGATTVELDRIRLTGVTSNTTLTIPQGRAIQSIFIENTAAGAVTGGIRIGTTDGGAQVVVAQAVGGFSFSRKINDNDVLLNKFSTTADTTLYLQAVTNWNSAVLKVHVVLVPTE